jgi:hypothetical protein
LANGFTSLAFDQTDEKQPFPLPQKRLLTRKRIKHLILGRPENPLSALRLLSWNKDRSTIRFD